MFARQWCQPLETGRPHARPRRLACLHSARHPSVHPLTSPSTSTCSCCPPTPPNCNWQGVAESIDCSGVGASGRRLSDITQLWPTNCGPQEGTAQQLPPASRAWNSGAPAYCGASISWLTTADRMVFIQEVCTNWQTTPRQVRLNIKMQPCIQCIARRSSIECACWLRVYSRARAASAAPALRSANASSTDHHSRSRYRVGVHHCALANHGPTYLTYMELAASDSPTGVLLSGSS